MSTNGWTPERRAKQAELIRNWQPWTKSTGAKTEQGKAVVSMNACKGYRRVKSRESMRYIKDCLRAMKLLVEMRKKGHTPELIAAYNAIAQRVGLVTFRY